MFIHHYIFYMDDRSKSGLGSGDSGNNTGKESIQNYAVKDKDKELRDRVITLESMYEKTVQNI